MKKKIALLSALALISMASCSNSGNSASAGNTSDSSAVSENETATDENGSAIEETTADPNKDPDKFNTYSMEELFGEKSPLIGYWHTNGKDMYIEYNEFGSEAFTVFILGDNLQAFSSKIGTFSGTPRNTEYILASSEDDADVANLFNKSTKFNMAINDDNTIAVFLDFGYGKTSTYTFEKSHISAEALAPYCGNWTNGSSTEISFTADESNGKVKFQTIFGFSTDQYPIGIPSVSDDNECWICCPYKKGTLTDFSDQGVFFDIINIHMELNDDGTVNLGRSYTSPTLINSGLSSQGPVVSKVAETE